MNPKDVALKTMTLGGNWLPPRVENNRGLQAGLLHLTGRIAASLRSGTIVGSIVATLLHRRAAAELGVRHAAGRFFRTASELRGAAACLLFYHLCGAATGNLCDRFRRAAARLCRLAASQAFRATLLNSGTTAFVLGATLQTLLTAAETSVRFAAGALFFAAGELGRTTVLGLFVSDGGSGEQQAKNEDRTGKQFRKHGKFSSECRVKNQRSLRRR